MMNATVRGKISCMKITDMITYKPVTERPELNWCTTKGSKAICELVPEPKHRSSCDRYRQTTKGRTCSKDYLFIIA